MASLQECQAALLALAERFATVDPELRRRLAADRTVACRVRDLDVVFFVRVIDGHVVELVHRPGDAPAAPAQVRLAATSDDLVALVAGALTPQTAWASGRLTVEASVLDLLRLRTLL